MKPQLQIHRTTAENVDFRALVKELDAFLAVTDGEEHEFYDQFNKLDKIRYAVVLYSGGEAVACGAIKEYDNNSMEVKRMFTRPAFRGRHLAETVLAELEKWTVELGYTHCILETGIRQTAAIALYERCGYTYIPCYGQYENMENSRCFSKSLVNDE